MMIRFTLNFFNLKLKIQLIIVVIQTILNRLNSKSNNLFIHQINLFIQLNLLYNLKLNKNLKQLNNYSQNIIIKVQNLNLKLKLNSLQKQYKYFCSMSDFSGILATLIPKVTQKQNNIPSRLDNNTTQTRRVIVTTTTSNYNTQSQSANKLPNTQMNINQTRTINSPLSWRPAQGSLGSNRTQIKGQTSTAQHKTTYFGSISPITNAYKLEQKTTYQSPQHNVTAFNTGIGSPVIQYGRNDNQNQTSSYKYSTSLNSTTLNNPASQTFQTYKHINICSGGSGEGTPMSYLMNDRNSNNDIISSGQQKFFHSYSGGSGAQNKRITPTNKITFSSSGNQFNSTLYQPISGGVTTSAYNKFQPITNVTASTYQPSTLYRYEVTSNKIYAPPITTTTYNTSSYSLPFNSNKLNNNYNDQRYTTITTNSYQPQPINIRNQQQSYTRYQQNANTQNSYAHHNVITNANSNNQTIIRQEININNKAQKQQKGSKLYEVIDEIERPAYEKLYANDEQQRRRLPLDTDPPAKKTICTPLCWIPLLILGFLLALFGMLCGLGIICPGLKGLGTAPSADAQGLIPSIVPHITTPSKQTPDQKIPYVNPQTVKPSAVSPVQIGTFNAGQPINTTNISQRGYIQPISIAPNTNPMLPLDPGYKINITKNNTGIAPVITGPAQKPIQFDPQVIKYEKNIDNYWIQAQPTVVGVTTYTNNQPVVLNSTKVNTQPINSYYDYSSKSGIIPSTVANKTSIQNIASTNIAYPNTTTNTTIVTPSTPVSLPVAPISPTILNTTTSIPDTINRPNQQYFISPSLITPSTTLNTTTSSVPFSSTIAAFPTSSTTNIPSTNTPINLNISIPTGLNKTNQAKNTPTYYVTEETKIAQPTYQPVKQNNSKASVIENISSSLPNSVIVPIVQNNKVEIIRGNKGDIEREPLPSPAEFVPAYVELNTTKVINSPQNTTVLPISPTGIKPIDARQPWDDAIIPPKQAFPTQANPIDNIKKNQNYVSGVFNNSNIQSASISPLISTATNKTINSTQSMNADQLNIDTKTSTMNTSIISPSAISNPQGITKPEMTNNITQVNIALTNNSTRIDNKVQTTQWNNAIYLPIQPLVYPTEQFKNQGTQKVIIQPFTSLNSSSIPSTIETNNKATSINNTASTLNPSMPSISAETNTPSIQKIVSNISVLNDVSTTQPSLVEVSPVDNLSVVKPSSTVTTTESPVRIENTFSSITVKQPSVLVNSAATVPSTASNGSPVSSSDNSANQFAPIG